MSIFLTIYLSIIISNKGELFLSTKETFLSCLLLLHCLFVANVDSLVGQTSASRDLKSHGNTLQSNLAFLNVVLFILEKMISSGQDDKKTQRLQYFSDARISTLFAVFLKSQTLLHTIGQELNAKMTDTGQPSYHKRRSRCFYSSVILKIVSEFISFLSLPVTIIGLKRKRFSVKSCWQFSVVFKIIVWNKINKHQAKVDLL